MVVVVVEGFKTLSVPFTGKQVQMAPTISSLEVVAILFACGESLERRVIME